MSDVVIALIILAGGLVLLGIARIADPSIFGKVGHMGYRPFENRRSAVALFFAAIGAIAVGLGGVAAIVAAIG